MAQKKLGMEKTPQPSVSTMSTPKQAKLGREKESTTQDQPVARGTLPKTPQISDDDPRVSYKVNYEKEQIQKINEILKKTDDEIKSDMKLSATVLPDYEYRDATDTDVKSFRENLKAELSKRENNIKQIKSDVLLQERVAREGYTEKELLEQEWDRANRIKWKTGLTGGKLDNIKSIEKHPAYSWVDIALNKDEPDVIPIIDLSGGTGGQIKSTKLGAATTPYNEAGWLQGVDVVGSYIQSNPITKQQWETMSDTNKLKWLNGLYEKQFETIAARGHQGQAMAPVKDSGGGEGEEGEGEEGEGEEGEGEGKDSPGKDTSLVGMRYVGPAGLVSEGYGSAGKVFAHGATGLASLSPAARQIAETVGYGNLSGTEVSAINAARQSQPTLSGVNLASVIYSKGDTALAAKLGSKEALATIIKQKADLENTVKKAVVEGKKTDAQRMQEKQSTYVLLEKGDPDNLAYNKNLVDLIIDGKVKDAKGNILTLENAVKMGAFNNAVGTATQIGESLGVNTETGEKVGFKGDVWATPIGDLADIAAPGFAMYITKPDGWAYVYRKVSSEDPLGRLVVYDKGLKGTSLNTAGWDLDKPYYGENRRKISEYQDKWGEENTWNKIKDSVDMMGNARLDNELGLTGHVLNFPLGDYVKPETGLMSWGEFVAKYPDLGLQYEPEILNTVKLSSINEVWKKVTELELAKRQGKTLSDDDNKLLAMASKYKLPSGEIDYANFYKEYVPNILEPAKRAEAEQMLQQLIVFKLDAKQADELRQYVQQKRPADRNEVERRIFEIYNQHLTQNKGKYSVDAFALMLNSDISNNKSQYATYLSGLQVAPSIEKVIDEKARINAESLLKPIIEGIQERFIYGTIQLTPWEQYILEQKAKHTFVDQVDYVGLEKTLQSKIDEYKTTKSGLQGTPSELKALEVEETIIEPKESLSRKYFTVKGKEGQLSFTPFDILMDAKAESDKLYKNNIKVSNLSVQKDAKGNVVLKFNTDKPSLAYVEYVGEKGYSPFMFGSQEWDLSGNKLSTEHSINLGNDIKQFSKNEGSLLLKGIRLVDKVQDKYDLKDWDTVYVPDSVYILNEGDKKYKPSAQESKWIVLDKYFNDFNSGSKVTRGGQSGLKGLGDTALAMLTLDPKNLETWGMVRYGVEPPEPREYKPDEIVDTSNPYNIWKEYYIKYQVPVEIQKKIYDEHFKAYSLSKLQQASDVMGLPAGYTDVGKEKASVTIAPTELLTKEFNGLTPVRVLGHELAHHWYDSIPKQQQSNFLTGINDYYDSIEKEGKDNSFTRVIRNVWDLYGGRNNTDSSEVYARIYDEILNISNDKKNKIHVPDKFIEYFPKSLQGQLRELNGDIDSTYKPSSENMVAAIEMEQNKPSKELEVNVSEVKDITKQFEPYKGYKVTDTKPQLKQIWIEKDANGVYIVIITDKPSMVSLRHAMGDVQEDNKLSLTHKFPLTGHKYISNIALSDYNEYHDANLYANPSGNIQVNKLSEIIVNPAEQARLIIEGVQSREKLGTAGDLQPWEKEVLVEANKVTKSGVVDYNQLATSLNQIIDDVKTGKRELQGTPTTLKALEVEETIIEPSKEVTIDIESLKPIVKAGLDIKPLVEQFTPQKPLFSTMKTGKSKDLGGPTELGDQEVVYFEAMTPPDTGTGAKKVPILMKYAIVKNADGTIGGLWYQQEGKNWEQGNYTFKPNTKEVSQMKCSGQYCGNMKTDLQDGIRYIYEKNWNIPSTALPAPKGVDEVPIAGKVPTVVTENVTDVSFVKPKDVQQFKEWKIQFDKGVNDGVYGDIKDAVFAGVDKLGLMRYVPKDLYDKYGKGVKEAFDNLGTVGAEAYVNNAIKGIEQYKKPDGNYDIYQYAIDASDNNVDYDKIVENLRIFAGDNIDVNKAVDQIIQWIPSKGFLSDKAFNALSANERAKYSQEHPNDPRVIFEGMLSGLSYHRTWEEGLKNTKFKGQSPSAESISQAVNSFITDWNKDLTKQYNSWKQGIQSIPVADIITAKLPQDRQLPPMVTLGVFPPLVGSEKVTELKNVVANIGMSEQDIQKWVKDSKESQIKGFMNTGLSRTEATKRVEQGFGYEAILRAAQAMQEIGKMTGIIPLMVAEDFNRLAEGDKTAIVDIAEQAGALTFYAIPNMAGSITAKVAEGKPGAAIGEGVGYGIGMVVGPHNLVKLGARGVQKVVDIPKTQSQRAFANTIEIPMAGVPPKVGVGRMLALLQNIETIFKDGDFTRDRVVYDSAGKMIARVTPMARAGVPDWLHVTNRFDEYVDAINKEGVVKDLEGIAARGSPFPGKGAYFSPNASVRLGAAIEPVGNKTGIIAHKFTFKQVPKEVQDIYNELSKIDESKVNFDIVNDVVNRAVEKYLELEASGKLERGTYPVFKTWDRPNVERVLEYLKTKGIKLDINPKEPITSDKLAKLTEEYNKIPANKRLPLNEWVLELEGYRTNNAPLYPTKPAWDTTIKEVGDKSGASYLRVDEEIKNGLGKVVVKKGDKLPILWLSEEPNDVAPSLMQRMEAEWLYEPLSQFRRVFRPVKTKLGFGYGNIRLGELDGLEISHYTNPNDYFALPRRGTSIIRNPQNKNQILVGKAKEEVHYDTIGGSNFKFGTTILESGEAPIEISLVREAIDEGGIIPTGGKYVGQMTGRHMNTKLPNGQFKEGERVFDLYEVEYAGQPKPSSEIDSLAWYDGKNLYDLNGKKIVGKVSDITPELLKYANQSKIKVDAKITEPQRALEVKKPVAIRWDKVNQKNIIVPKEEIAQVLLVDEFNNPVKTVSVSRQEGQTVKDAIKTELDKQGIDSNQYSYIATEYKFPNNEWSETVPGTILDTYAVRIKPKGYEYGEIDGRSLELFKGTLGTRVWKEFNPALTDNKVYISADLSDKSKLQLAKIQSKLKEEARNNNWSDIEWQDPDKLHITLRFVGKMPKEDLPKLAKAIEKVNEYVKKQNIKLEASGWEAWPNVKDVSVISMRMKDINNMGKAYTLQRIVDAAATEAGLSPATYKFEPHITLAEVPDTVPLVKKMEIGGYLAKNRNKEVIPIDEYNIKVKESGFGDVIAEDTQLKEKKPVILRDVKSTGIKEAEISGSILKDNPHVPENIVNGIATEQEFKTYHADAYQKGTGQEIPVEQLQRDWLYYKETQPMAIKGELTPEKAWQIVADINKRLEKERIEPKVSDPSIETAPKVEIFEGERVSKLEKVPTPDRLAKIVRGESTEQEYKSYYADEYKMTTGREMPIEQLNRDWQAYQENMRPVVLKQKIIEGKATPDEIVEVAQTYNIPEEKVKQEFSRHGYVYGGLRSKYPAPDYVSNALSEGVRRYNQIPEKMLNDFDIARKNNNKLEIQRLVNELDTQYGVMLHEGRYGDIPLPSELSDVRVPKYLAESKGEAWTFEGQKLQQKIDSLNLYDIYKDAKLRGDKKLQGLADEIDTANIRSTYISDTLREMVRDLYGGELNNVHLSKLSRGYRRYAENIDKPTTTRFSEQMAGIDKPLENLVEKVNRGEATDVEIAEWVKETYPEYNRGFKISEEYIPKYVESFKQWAKESLGESKPNVISEIRAKLNEYNNQMRSIKFNEYYGSKGKYTEVKVGTAPYFETGKYGTKEYSPSIIASYVKVAYPVGERDKYATYPPLPSYPSYPLYPPEVGYPPKPTYPSYPPYPPTGGYPPTTTYPPTVPIPPMLPPTKPPIPPEKKRTWEGLTPEERTASIVWKQGFYHYALPEPWRQEDLIGSSKPFAGTKIHHGPLAAYKSVAMVKGDKLPEKIQINLGTQDLEFIKDRYGKDVIVRYKLDPNYIGAKKGYTKEKTRKGKREKVEPSVSSMGE